MKISFLIFLGFSIVLVLSFITTYVNYRQSQAVVENTSFVSTSQIVLKNTTRYQRSILEMESGLRGFLFTGETSFLAPFDSAKNEHPLLFKELDSLIQKNSQQQKNLY